MVRNRQYFVTTFGNTASEKHTVIVTLEVLCDRPGENEIIVGEVATFKIAPGATAVEPEPPLLKFK